MLIPVQQNPSWQLSLAQLSPSLFSLFLTFFFFVAVSVSLSLYFVHCFSVFFTFSLSIYVILSLCLSLFSFLCLSLSVFLSIGIAYASISASSLLFYFLEGILARILIYSYEFRVVVFAWIYSRILVSVSGYWLNTNPY